MMNNNPYQQFQPIPHTDSSPPTPYPPSATPYPPPSSAAPYPPPSSAAPYPPPAATPYPPPAAATPYPPPASVITDEQKNQADQYWSAGAANVPTGSYPINHNATASWDGSGSGSGGIAVGNPNHQYNYPQPQGQGSYIQQNTAQEPYKNSVDITLKRFSSWGSKAEKTAINTVGNTLKRFNSWSSKAEKSATNVLHNLTTGSSVSGTAWGKVNLTAKAVTEGGFEKLFKQTFTTFPQEKLKKTFACHLSTSSGPVAGTLYLSNLHVSFCSDSPLSFKDLSGKETWSYYKIMVPLGKIANINPFIKKDEDSLDKYIQIATFDGQEFWFMGFVNHDKASKHLVESISGFAAPGIPVHQQPF